MPGNDEDQALIDACRAGQTDAYGALVRKYQDRLYPTVLRLTGRAEDAQDLLQEAFLRAYEKLNRFHGESSFYTWVYRIAVNLALSSRRKRRPAAQFAAHAAPTPDPGETDPSLPLERAERERVVQDALNALAPDHRAVVVLKEYDGLHYDAIAAVLGIPVGTVRSRLHRARCELRDRLRGLIDREAPLRHSVADGG